MSTRSRLAITPLRRGAVASSAQLTQLTWQSLVGTRLVMLDTVLPPPGPPLAGDAGHCTAPPRLVMLDTVLPPPGRPGVQVALLGASPVAGGSADVPCLVGRFQHVHAHIPGEGPDGSDRLAEVRRTAGGSLPPRHKYICVFSHPLKGCLAAVLRK